ncbi:hypothetical protein DFS34DRAFT_580979 [Phlyctochytrium arcticum]|nr:hypothetical protein DFS34DRAFT_580979 [Phlyctochytrium arcticum]
MVQEIPLPDIPGARLFEDFISPEEAAHLISKLDARHWGGAGIAPNPQLRRRTQQYGYEYNFVTRTIVSPTVEALPEHLETVASRMESYFGEDRKPDFVIINEYLEGQGIMPHMDALPFGPSVASLSMLSPCVMTMQHKASGKVVQTPLQVNSLLLLQGEARYEWTHGIGKEMVQYWDGGEIVRGERRVSATFRCLKHETGVAEKSCAKAT